MTRGTCPSPAQGVALVLVLLLLPRSSVDAVPARIANRMVPSWWQYASTACYSQSECGADECCARPMLSSRAYCMPLKRRWEACDSTPFLLDNEQQVFFGDCPCEGHLICASTDNISQCTDYHSLELDYSRYVVQPSGHLVTSRHD